MPAGRVLAVLGVRRRAVGHRAHDARARALRARSDEPRGDVVLAAQPVVERRHRHGRVLVDQLDQRVDVVALERVDVAVEQLAAGPRPSRRRCRCRRRRRESSVARARCSALLTEATDVSSSWATSSACQRSTSRRISTARWRGGRYCSAATNARRIVSRATATSAGIAAGGDGAAVRHRLDPHVVGQAGRQRRRRVRGLGEIHRAGPSLAGAEHVEAHVRGDAVQPRPQRRAALEAVDVLPGADQRQLRRRPRPPTRRRASGSSSR